MAVTFQGTEVELRAALADFPRVLAGQSSDVNGIGRSLQLRIGVTLLSRVQTAFIAKARGGTGDDGITWKPLTRATIAGRRITAGERKAAGIKGKRVRGLLTPAQDKRWRMIFATRKAWLMAHGEGSGAAAARAASITWTVLKSEGAKTRLGTFGDRKVEIGRDSGRLFRSFSPGVEDRPSGEAEQVFDVPRGQVIVGTNVIYAAPFHRVRPFWPASLPAPWWQAILLSLQRGIVKVMSLYLAGRTP